MRTKRRVLLFMCLLASIICVAACGAQDTSGPNSAKRSYKVTRCDGSPIAHASLSKQPPNAQPSIYVGTRASAASGNLGISALAPDDGTLRWCLRFAFTRTFTCALDAHCPPPPIALVGTPLVAGDVVYVCVSGGPPGVLFALNAADGALRWSRETGCQIVSMPFGDGARPILTDGVLYSGSIGLALADGSVHWHLPPQLTQSTLGAVAGGVVYAYSEGAISAVRVSDSKVTWTYTLGASIGDRPVPVGNHLYVGDIAGDSPPAVTHGLPDTYALDTRTGSVIWRAPTGIVSGSSAVEEDGLVYIGAENSLYALDAATGTIRWRVQVAHGGSVQSTPVVSNGVVYFMGDGAYAVDATTGAVRWHKALGWNLSKAFVGPALRDGILYLVGVDGSGRSMLYALDATIGAIRWQRTDMNPQGTPIA
jgi:outer membrane protein assembly factor BamB